MKYFKGWAFPTHDNYFQKYVADYPSTSYQQECIDTVYKFVKNFNNVIDVGANIGLHSVRFSQKFKNVFSFEPISYNFECLEKNTESIKNIIKYNHGLGDCEKKEIISLPITLNNCGAFSAVDFKTYQEQDLISEEIDIKKLDDLNLECDLIKIDTQGYELPVIRGSFKTLEKHKPVIILEIEKRKNIRYMNNTLSELGYEYAGSVARDLIWVHSDNHEKNVENSQD